MLVNIVSFYSSQRWDQYPNKYSLGSMRLAGYVLKQLPNIDIRLTAFEMSYPNEDIAQQIADNSVDIVALPGYIYTKYKSHRISQLIHQKSLKTLVVYGGPDVISMETKSWSGQDLFIIGQGEEPFLWICQQKAKNESFGTSHLSPDVPYAIFSKNIDRKLVMDKIILDRGNKQLPEGEPLYSEKFMTLFGETPPGNLFSWFETARGCIYSCSFCAHNTLPFFANFDLEYVKQEIINMSSVKMKELFIVEPILGGQPSRGKEILHLFLKYAPEIKLTAYMRPEFLDEEFIELIAVSNIKEILIGIQTINPNIPHSVRSNNIKRIKKFLPELTQKNVIWRAELIAGLPGDTIDGLRQSLKFVIDDLQPRFVYTYHLTAIPNTPLYELLNKTDEEYWLTADAESGRVISSSSFSPQEMIEMLIYGGAFTSLYATLKNYQSSSDNNVNFDDIDSIVSNYLLNATEYQKNIFRQQIMSESIDIWNKELMLNLYE
jgi:radical SAM superfamily enzyme YgiQ (UPF0313 family)